MKAIFPASLALLALLALGACQSREMTSGIIARLPDPVSNAAVARVGDTVYAFAGLHGGKTWRDVTADAYACSLKAGTCRKIAPLPDGTGRLAASAVALKGRIYILGGYSVAADGAEKSTPEVWVFDPQSETYARTPDMPVPVDDSLALGFEGRYVVLVSGWHDHDNVSLVQVLDTQKNRWFRATGWPGAPVFGHAGAISGNHLLICGGVRVVPPKAPGQRRSFVLSKACWQGTISADAQKIDWSATPDNPPGAAYRRAALALPDGRIAFYGGALNPYNYDGIGYDGAPAAPLGRVDMAGFGKNGRLTWQSSPAPAGMDFRDGLYWRGALVTLGGMDAGQRVVDTVRAIPLAGIGH